MMSWRSWPSCSTQLDVYAGDGSGGGRAGVGWPSELARNHEARLVLVTHAPSQAVFVAAGRRCSLSYMGTDGSLAGQHGPADRDRPVDAAAALAERLFQDVVGALELYTVYLGDRLGLYRALDTGGPATSAELAGRTGTVERYVREWLEHQAASGLLEVDDQTAGPLARRYRLPPAHVPVLADPDDVRYRAFSGVEIVRAGRWLPQLVEAFRTGDAPSPLPWAPEGRADYNRAVFLNLLGTQWLPAIADVHGRLCREPPARVADLACGHGWSSIAIARAYPLVRVDGFDLDPDVIAAARRNAEQAAYPAGSPSLSPTPPARACPAVLIW